MSFESGYRTALDQDNARQDRARQARLDAQAAELHQMRMAELQDAANRRKQVAGIDAELAAAWDNGGFTPQGQGALQQRYGLNPDQIRAAGSALPAQVAGYDQPDNSDLMNQSVEQYRAQNVDPELTRRRNMTGLQAKRAIATGDMQALQGLDAQRRQIDLDEVVKRVSKKFDDMDERSLAASIEKASYDRNIRGHGTWVPGKGKSEGYMIFVPPGQDPVKLTKQELRDITIASAMNEASPGSGEALLRSTTENARRVAAEMAKDARENAQTNNTAVHYANADANDAARTRAQLAWHTQQAQMAKLGAVRQYEDPNTHQVTEWYPETTPGGVKWKPVPVPQGLQPYQPKMKMTPAQYAENYARLKQAGVDDIDIKSILTGEDQISKLAEILARNKGKNTGNSPTAVEANRDGGKPGLPFGITPPDPSEPTPFDRFKEALPSWNPRTGLAPY